MPRRLEVFDTVNSEDRISKLLGSKNLVPERFRGTDEFLDVWSVGISAILTIRIRITCRLSAAFIYRMLEESKPRQMDPEIQVEIARRNCWKPSFVEICHFHS